MASGPGSHQEADEPSPPAAFPPQSISLPTFLKGGSDEEFRDLIYRVLSISTMMLRAREHFAAQMNVSGPQYSMIVAIAESKAATVGLIASKLHVSSPFVTAEIGKLISQGIVERRPNEADRRSNLLVLTPFGHELIEKVGPLRRKTNDMIFGSLTPEQARLFSEIVNTLLADSEHAIHVISDPKRAQKRR